MTKSDMIEVIHKALDCKLSRNSAKLALEALFDSFRKEFMAGHDLAISGLGSFKVVTRKPRKGHNPKTGESIVIGERRSVTFRSCPRLKKDLNGDK